MFRTLKYNLTHNWSLIRLLRLVLGIIVIFEAFYNYEWMFAVLGIVLSGQALLNIGCCAGSACYSGKLNNDLEEKKEIVYEEIK